MRQGDRLANRRASPNLGLYRNRAVPRDSEGGSWFRAALHVRRPIVVPVKTRRYGASFAEVDGLRRNLGNAISADSPRRALAGAFSCQATGSSPSVGWLLSSLDDGVSRNRVASVAANATDCRCVRASF